MGDWPEGLVLALELGLLVYALFVALTIVLEQRRPAATLAWVLALVFVPFLGLLAYLLIGRRKARRSRRLRRRRTKHPTLDTAAIACVASSPPDLGPRAAGLLRLALRRSAGPVRRARSVEIIPDPPEVFASIERAILGARHRIHLEFYIWRGDATGERLIELLAQRARAGVDVRLLYDEIGSIGTPSRHFDPLREAGGQVAPFAPLRLRLRQPRGRLDFRNHRKLLCVDGELGFTGGVNIGDEYRGLTTSGRIWNDLFVRIEGEAMLGLEATFLEDWLTTTGREVALDAGLPRSERPRPPSDTGPLVQIVSSGPDHPPGPRENNASVIGETFLAAIGGSLERVWIVTPYFIPDESLNRILQTAAMRGVDVKILVPNLSDSDLGFVALAARSYYDDLLAAGCKIYEYAPGMNHAKYMVIDDTVAFIGSANMDIRSLYLNYEITAIFYDHEVTGSLCKVFNEELADGVAITAAARGAVRPAWRLAESLARVMSPLL